MSMKRERGESRMGTGATSMLMIFIVLCLTTLSILSLATARSDLSMSRRGMHMTQAYYDAADRVQVILSEIDAQLLAMQREALRVKTDEVETLYAEAGYEDPDAMRAMILDEAEAEYARLARGVAVEGVEIAMPEGKGAMSFTVDAGHERFLQVEIELAPPGGDARYRVTKHVMAFKSEWAPDLGYELYTGLDEEAMDDLEGLEEGPSGGYENSAQDELEWLD